MPGSTNRGKFRLLEHEFRRTALPTSYFLVLVTSSGSPGADTNVLGELTEIAAGNGYDLGGIELTPGETDFDVINEDDDEDLAAIQIRDITILATGGQIPITGDPAFAVVITDDNVVLADREVFDYWSLGAETTILENNSLTLRDLTLRAREI
jgi:hypothetical protein